MIEGFPTALLDYLVCPRDGADLAVGRIAKGSDQAILDGTITCANCGSSYAVRSGILSVLYGERATDERNQYEMTIRDAEAGAASDQWEDAYAVDSEMEIPSTLRRLAAPDPSQRLDVLELGCGTGRYTRFLSEMFRLVLAVDFSMRSLVVNTQRLGRAKNVGFVHADVACLRIHPDRFDRALSTFYSNLPTREIRDASTRVAWEGLKYGGKYVLSAHAYHPRDMLKKLPAARTYENGIYYQCFTPNGLREEMRTYFSSVKMETVCIWIPIISRILKARVPLSKMAERLPLLNRLGSILLATATKT